MSSLPAQIKKYFWYFAVPFIPISVFTMLFIANLHPVSDLIDSTFVTINSFTQAFAGAYLNFLPENLSSNTSEFFTKLRFNPILNNLFRAVILTNLLIAVYITLKSLYDSSIALIKIIKNQQSAIRIFFPLTYLIKDKSNEKPWGLVYDAVTKKPIDPAVVTIATHENGVGEFKQTRITDISGRFSFLITPGHYILSAEKTNYSFPSKIITGTTDGKVQNIYHGEVIEVNDPYIINLNIPMDPLGYDWNQAVKPDTYNATLELIRDKGRLFVIIWGITTAFFSYIFLPSAVNIILLFLYPFNFLFVKTQITKKLWGTVYYKTNQQPIPRVTVKAVNQKVRLALGHTTTDHLGRYYLLLSQGIYTIVVESEEKNRTVKTLAKIENVQVTKQNEIIDFDIAV